MAENLYITWNAAMPTTALPAKTTTGTAANVLLQVAPSSTVQLTIVEWGVFMDGSPSAVQWSLTQTNAAATMGTAAVASGIMPFNNPGAPTSTVQLGAALTAFNSGSTVTPTGTTTLTFDAPILTTNTYVKQWPLQREPQIAVSTFVQLRVLAAAAVSALCYIIWRE